MNFLKNNPKKKIIFFLFLSIFGYWYNLGIVNIGVDFRLYDITFLPLLFYFAHYKNKSLVFDKFKFIKYFYEFLILLSCSLIISLIVKFYNDNLFSFFRSLIHLYHAWGFLVVTFFVLILYKENIFRNRLFKFIILIILIENIVLFLQLIGMLDVFW